MNKENEKNLEYLIYKSIQDLFTITFERIENLEKKITEIEIKESKKNGK